MYSASGGHRDAGVEAEPVDTKLCPSGVCISSDLDLRSVIHTSLSRRVSLAIGTNNDRIVYQ
jgi:hypothetical protein